MDQILLEWSAKSSAAFTGQPKPIAGLAVTITPRQQVVEYEGVSVLLRVARGETDKFGTLVTMPLATEGVKIPDVPVIWDVSVFGSQHVTQFGFAIAPYGKGATQNLAVLADLPGKPEDSELGAWLDIAADVAASRSDAEALAYRAEAAAVRAEDVLAHEKGEKGDPGPKGDKGDKGDASPLTTLVGTPTTIASAVTAPGTHTLKKFGNVVFYTFTDVMLTASGSAPYLALPAGFEAPATFSLYGSATLRDGSGHKPIATGDSRNSLRITSGVSGQFYRGFATWII